MLRILKMIVIWLTLLAVTTVVTTQLTGLTLVPTLVISSVVSLLIVLMFDSKGNKNQLNTTLMRFNKSFKKNGSQS